MDWKQTVAALAPTIGTALGGPLGGMAAGVLCNALGLQPGSSESAITAAIADPEALTKIRLAEIDFQKTLEQNNIDLEKIHADDRNSARQREVSTNDHTPRVLAALIVTGYMVIQWYILTHLVPPEMRDIVLRSMGTLDMSLGMVLTYYFGSSAGSARKDALMAGKK